LFGIALALMPLGLEAIGYELSRKQGYALLGLTALFVVAAIVIFFWPWVRGAWSWLRRDNMLREVERERDEARATLGTLEQRLEEFGLKLTGDLDKQIAKTKELTNELRSDRLEEELREAKQENKRLQDQIEDAAKEVGLPPSVATERRIANCDFHIYELLRLAGEGFIIEGKDFENCTIRGPGVISTFEDVRPPEKRTDDNSSLGSAFDTHSLSVEGEPESVLHEVPWDSEGASGVIHLVGCTYRRVTFKDIGIAGSPAEIKFWRENVRFRGKRSVGLPGLEVRIEENREEDGGS
jgi:hypothetical protein